MVSQHRAVLRIPDVLLFVNRTLRILGGAIRLDPVDQRPIDADGPEHGDVPLAAGRRNDDRGPPGRQAVFWQRLQPSHVLWTIATVGLLAYAMIHGMDATVTAMLTGLFGAMFGPMMMGRNGNK